MKHNSHLAALISKELKAEHDRNKLLNDPRYTLYKLGYSDQKIEDTLRYAYITVRKWREKHGLPSNYGLGGHRTRAGRKKQYA